MALIKLGAVVTQISGKVGGTTFGHGSNGSYMKNRGSYINKQTTKRKAVNTALASITSQWRTLSDAQRLGWQALSPSFPYVNRIGNTAYLSGFNLFTQFNYNRVLNKTSILSSAPAVSSRTAPASVSITVVGRAVTVTTSGGSSTAICKVYISAGISAGSQVYLPLKRFMSVQTVSTMSSGFNATTLFESSFGLAVAGMRYFAHIECFDPASGQPIGTFVVDSVVAS